MSYDKLWTLVELLSRKTKAGTLAWETTSDSNAFQVALQDFSVIVREDSDSERETYSIEVYNKEGTMIESATDSDFAYRIPSNAMGATGALITGMLGTSLHLPTPTDEMRGLYQSARRCAFGVEKALDEIITELKK